jgi:hypothetical protein
VVILQSAIDPFGRAAFTVTNLFRHAMPDTPRPPVPVSVQVWRAD